MRISKLLVLSALWLIGLGANAAVELTERKAPTEPANKEYTGDALNAISKTNAEFKEGASYVLYNKDAQKFFVAGSDWGTRATANATKAARVYFTATEAAKKLGDGVYELKNYVKSTMLSAFGEDNENIWTDNDGNDGRFWKLVPVEGAYRITNAKIKTDERFIGMKSTDDQDRLFLTAIKDGQNFDWQLFALPEWDAYDALNLVYKKAEELKELIVLADTLKLTEAVTTAAAVYNNADATIEQLESAIQTLDEAVIAKKLADNKDSLKNATLENGIDATFMLNNTDFTSGKYDGWSGSSAGIEHGVAEFYNTNYDTYQNLKGMPGGIYKVELQGFYRPGGDLNNCYKRYQNGVEQNAMITMTADNHVVQKPLVYIFEGATADKLNGGSDEPSVNVGGDAVVYVPSMRVTVEKYFQAGRYQNYMYFGVADGASIKLGLKKDKLQGSDWTPFDNWKLTYYGNSAEAYLQWMTEVKNGLAIPAGAIATTSYLNAFNGVNLAVANQAEAEAAIKDLKTKYDTLLVNIDLWKQYEALVEEAKTVAGNEDIVAKYRNELSDWANMDAPDVITAKALTNDELRAFLKSQKERVDWIKLQLEGDNVNMTFLLTNPDFENGAEGWEGAPAIGTGGGNTCAEAYNRANFDIYQTITQGKKGVYSIEVQAFFRLLRPKHEGANPNAWTKWQAGEQIAPAWVYLNDVQTPLQCIYSEGALGGKLPNETTYTKKDIDMPEGEEGNWYPNTMEQAAQAFAAGMYKSTAVGLVMNDNDPIRIGIKGNLEGANWAIWDNFKLTYLGFSVDVVKPILEEETEKVSKKIDESDDNYVMMGKTAYETVANAVADAKTAAEAEDGEVMFAALSNLLATDSIINASSKVFAELKTANQKLADAISGYEDASEDAIEAATTLNETISDLLPAHSIEDSLVAGYIQKIEEAIAALRIPVYDGASDDEAVNFTTVIINPDYATDNNGWSGTGASRNGDAANAEMFNKDYDYYQDLTGLPAGTYMLRVSAFYRAGEAKQDYERLDSIEYDNAYLYARTVTETDTVQFSKALQRLASTASEIRGGVENEEGLDWATDWRKEIRMDQESGASKFAIVDERKVDSIQGTVKIDSIFAVKNTAGTDSLDGNGKVVLDTVKVDSVVYYGVYEFRTVINNMTQAADLMAYDEDDEDEVADAKLLNELIFTLPENATLRIGLKKTMKIANDWTLFDDWHLYYFGSESERTADGDDYTTTVQDLSRMSRVIGTELYSIDGRRVAGAHKGLLLQKTILENGQIIVKKVRK